MKHIIGIDYSMTGPAIATHSGPVFSFANCNIFALTSQEKFVGEYGNITIDKIPEWDIAEERFDKLSDYFLEIILRYPDCIVAFENYSFASRGQTFHIGENTGILKHKLYKNNINYNVIAPTQVKKLAMGKGRGDKTKMYEAYEKECNVVDLRKALNYNKKVIDSPIADIVDSYFICKFQHQLTYQGFKNEN